MVWNLCKIVDFWEKVKLPVGKICENQPYVYNIDRYVDNR